MNEALAFESWDVFTDHRLAGNPLAVVFDATRLSTVEMVRPSPKRGWQRGIGDARYVRARRPLMRVNFVDALSLLA